jgi:hypothetical protein
VPFDGFPVFRSSPRTAKFDFRGAPPVSSRPLQGVEPNIHRRSAHACACVRPCVRLAHPCGRDGRKIDNPPGLPRPFGASGTGDPFNAGSLHPPRSDLGVSHALAGFLPPVPLRACFIPVTPLGFDVFRVFFLPKSRTSLEARPLVPFTLPARRLAKAERTGSASEGCSLRKSAPPKRF